MQLRMITVARLAQARNFMVIVLIVICDVSSSRCRRMGPFLSSFVVGFRDIFVAGFFDPVDLTSCFSNIALFLAFLPAPTSSASKTVAEWYHELIRRSDYMQVDKFVVSTSVVLCGRAGNSVAKWLG